MVTRTYQKDYQNLNLRKTIQWSQEDTKEIIRTYIYKRQYNGHKKIPKRLSEPKSKQDNTMVTRRYERDYQNLNLQKTIQWSQEDTKEIIRT
jgi:predicted nuclease of restriction endonuclease-like (RecB) superfamily